MAYLTWVCDKAFILPSLHSFMSRSKPLGVLKGEEVDHTNLLTFDYLPFSPRRDPKL